MKPTQVEFHTHAEKKAFLETCLALLRSKGWNPTAIHGVYLGLDETLVNALKHGNKEDQNKAVRVLFLITSDACSFEITDEGTGFDPDKVPDPLAPENLERASGRGILIMRHYMTKVIFEGNKVTLKKNNT